MPARFVLAVLTSAGILYANVAPVIVSGLVQSAGYTTEAAGYVFSANMYGTAIGGLAISLVIARLNWRKSAVILLALLIASDLVCAFTDTAPVLYSIRFIHGLAGGALIGVGFSVIARVKAPEVTFAILIFIQLSLGGIGTALLMPLIIQHGMSLVWLSLLGFSLISLILLPLLEDYAPSKDPIQGESLVQDAPQLAIVLSLCGIFCFQAGQMAAFAYVIEIGKSYLFDSGFISITVAVSLWIGAPAALFVAWWSTRSGRLLPVLLGTLCTILSVAMLLLNLPWAFIVANVGFGIFFSLTIPYLLGIASEMDQNGQVAATAGFISSLGLATGPAIAAMILGDGTLNQVIYFAIAVLGMSSILVLKPARRLDMGSREGSIQH